MDFLENLSRQLEDIRLDGTIVRSQFPCPRSVLRYLNYQESVNNPSNLTNASNFENGINVEDTPESPSRMRTKKRFKRRQKRKIKSSFEKPNVNPNEQNRSTTNTIEPISNHKDFYHDYMQLDDVKKGLESGELFEGYIRISQKCPTEAYVPSPDKSKDILLNGIKSRNRALDGDKVVVKIQDKSNWRNPDTEDCQRTGYVVYITNSKENRIVVGSLLVDRGIVHRYSTLIPRDCRIPRLLVDTSTWPFPIDLRDGTKESKDLFYAVLSRWDNYKIPIGILKGVLGESGKINAETEGILIAHDIQEHPYPEDIDKYFPPSFSVEEELKHRQDFRKHCIFSIDPPTAKDLDDALSCVLLLNGNYEIGIHISDVTYFVMQGTPLDEIAEKLATSVYLIQKVYHMLPPALTMMASLLPGTDKLAVSITLEMTPDANVISHSFSQSIIHSCAQLHYAHAQIFLENPDKKDWDESEFPTVYNGYTISDCATAVSHLHKLAAVMRERRFSSGALAINQPKLSFEIDRATCEPLSYSLYTLHESNWLIEEFMLLANTMVAEHLKTHFPTTAMLRNHQAPDVAPMEKAVKLLKTHDIDIDFTSAGSIQKSKAVYCQDENSKNSHWDIIINNILSKPMVRAEYCVIDPDRNMSHFALNVPYYTHFTSPIRRYPDIVVHRLLISWLTNKPIKEYEDPKVIEKIAINSNDRKNNAKKASEASAEIYAACLIGKLGGLEVDAAIMEIKENYFEATVLSMNMNVRVYVNISHNNPDLLHKISKFLIFDNKPTLVIWWDIKGFNKQTLQLFDKVKLKLLKRENCLKLRAILIRDE
ncbi:hypothetical protein QTP88_027564 [Uroleucon formosanum]